MKQFKLKAVLQYSSMIFMALFFWVACANDDEATDDLPREDSLNVDAGPDIEGKIGRNVEIDGSGTDDTSGETVTIDWVITAQPEGSDVELRNANSTRPEFTPEVVGSYSLKVTASTEFEEGEDEMNVNVISTLSVNAGDDFEGNKGRSIALDGSATTDTDGLDINYSWEVVASPDGSSIQLEDGATASPNFSTETKGTYTFLLTAATEFEEDTASVNVIIGSTLTTDAGEDMEGFIGRAVEIDGSGTTDTDGESITYEWSIIDAPEDSEAEIENNEQANAQFVSDLEGEYTLKLRASTQYESKTDEITLEISSSLTVDAGGDQEGEVRQDVTLDASATEDSQGEDISYLWAFVEKPEGSEVEIEDNESATATFVPDVAGLYQVILTAETEYESKSDEITIDVAPAPDTTVMISSNITEETVWEKLNSNPGVADYRITSNINISAKLTIEPGVIIELAENVFINLNESYISAVGTEQDSIVFTTANPEAGQRWGGIRVNSSDSRSIFEYVKLEKGAGANMNLGQLSNANRKTVFGLNRFGRVGIKNSTFYDNDGIALAIVRDIGDSRAELTAFENNAFMKNTSVAIEMGLQHTRHLDALTTFSENQFDGVQVFGGGTEGDMIWPALGENKRYRVNNDLNIADGLTIAAGTQIEFNENQLITVSTGYLSIEGTDQDPVLMTKSGNQNWRGIRYRSSDIRNKINHAVIEYAGSNDMNLGQLSSHNLTTCVGIDDFARVSITNSTFKNSNGHGLALRLSTGDRLARILDFENNHFENNALEAVFLGIHHIKEMDTQSTFQNNGFDGVRIAGGETIENFTWPKLGDGFRYKFTSNIAFAHEIIMEAGVESELDENVILSINEGYLSAAGTEGAPILFTTANLASGQNWGGIRFNSTDARNELDHVIVEFAGGTSLNLGPFSSNNRPANIGINDNARISITNTVSRNGQGHGIAVRPSANINDYTNTEANNNFSGNDLSNIENYE